MLWTKLENSGDNTLATCYGNEKDFCVLKIYFEEELIFAIAVDTRCHRSGELATISGSGRVGAYFLGTGHFIRNGDTLF